MARIDRYLLSQLLLLFGFFSLVLVLVYWVNRAVILFDQLIADGQSAGVFVEFTLLSLPNVIRLVLPIAAFAASVYVTNRLSSESELVAMQATGHSAYRLARPVFLFGLFVALLMSLLVHLLVPVSLTWTEERQAEIAENITARLLTEGQFLNPASGVTLYIREISPEAELRDIFLADDRTEGERTAYTAETAYLLRGEAGPQLVMRQGLVQRYETATGRLSTTSFDDFAYDIGSLMTDIGRGRVKPEELWTGTLLAATPATQSLTNKDAATLVQEGHQRITQAALALVAALIGFSTLLTGGFSRLGIWRQIVTAIFLLVLIKTVESVAVDAIDGRATLWPMLYVPVALGFLMVWVQLSSVSRPARRRRRVTA